MPRNLSFKEVFCKKLLGIKIFLKLLAIWKLYHCFRISQIIASQMYIYVALFK